MAPIHILITVSSHEDVFLPLLLGQMSQDSGVPFRVSVFLNNPVYAQPIQEMAKTFVQIDNPLLRKLRVARIACFDANAQPDSAVDLVLANHSEDLRTVAVGASVVVLNHVPSSTKLEGFSCDSLLTPFQQLADIAIANCAEKEGIAAEDIGNLGCFSRGEDLVIHARAAIRGHDRHFDADAEIAVQPLRNLALDAIPNRLTGVAFVASYLRSWQKNVSSTCLRRGAGDTLVVEAIAMRKGEIALQRAIDDATKNAARHLAAATVS